MIANALEDPLCAILLMALISAAIGWVFGEVPRRMDDAIHCIEEQQETP